MTFSLHSLRQSIAQERGLTAIIAIAVLIHVGGFFYVYATQGIDPFIYPDSRGYIALAENLATGKGFVSLQDGVLAPEVFRTPGLSVLLMPFVSGALPFWLYPLLMTVLAAVFFPLFTYRLASRFGGKGAALVAASLVAFEPNIIALSWAFLTETPFLLCMLPALWLLFRAFDFRSYAQAASAGGLFGLALYFRPGFLPIIVVTLIGTILCLAYKRRASWKAPLVALLCMFLVLSPWYVRMHSVTGVYALSGAGWRNVYTDLVSSVRSVDNGTDSADEKNAQTVASGDLGLTPSAINNPANSAVVRASALSELWARKTTFVKLESFALVAFFTNDNYYYLFRRFGFLPHGPVGVHISPTYAALRSGFGAVPAILGELGRQYFIPVIGRLFTLLITVLAVIGVFRLRHPARIAFAVVIVLAAITSTVIGFGVEARLRVPVMPLLFILAAPGIVSLVAWRKRALRMS